MIKKIYSKIDPKLLLSVVHTHEASEENIKEIKREGISDVEHFLQAMSYAIPKGTEIKPHKHNLQERNTGQTHEALLVFRGSVELSVYDTDNSLIEILKMKEGDCSVLINGGHSFKTLEKSEVFEFKNGPFLGSEKDRTYY